MKIVTNWKAHLKRYSMQALGALGLIQGAWLTLPTEIKDHLPTWLVTTVCVIIAAAGLFGGVLHQGIIEPDKDGDK